MRPGTSRLSWPLLGLVAVLVLGGCSGGPVLANPPVARPSPPVTPAPSPAPGDPIALAFPRDDGPHGRLMEWWYYTGHLRDSADGRRFGFEFVVFRAERGDLPVSWASHLAITDETGNRFFYGQRSEVGPQVDGSPRDPATGSPSGFALAVHGDAALPGSASPSGVAGSPADADAPGVAGQSSSSVAPGAGGSSAGAGAGALGGAGSSAGASAPGGVGQATLPRPWTMSGSNGADRIAAAFDRSQATSAGVPNGLGLDLRLQALKPPALHDTIGFIDFGPAGGSYYYSRTRMSAAGTVLIDGTTLRVDGTAWFDHQWGDFISVGAGGWDWFAVNLDDGTDLTLSLVRASDGSYPLVYGTLVDADGTTHHLDRSAFDVTALGTWTSPRTGARYPAGWRVTLPGRDLAIELTPTVADQELDTRPTSGVAYWEGSQRVRATRGETRLGGEGYVELTGYAGGQ